MAPRPAATYTYDPWGNTTSAGPLADTNPWTYATGYHDAATGYLKLGARYYNPTTARFTQPDPSGQEANAYNYASCNPANYTDPSGLMTWKDCGRIIFVHTATLTATGGVVGLLGGPFAEVSVPAGLAAGFQAGMVESGFECAFGALWDWQYGA
jgi:RHS repeat-associated protein